MKIFSEHTSHKLIGLSGPFAGGKDTAARHLEQKGFMHVSTGDVLRAEATRTGRDHQRETLIDIAVGLRQKYGSVGALVVKGIEQWDEQRELFAAGLVVSGLRVVGEARELQDQGGRLGYMEAPVALRYEWAKKRAEQEGRTIELEQVHSLEDFKESKRSEMEGLDGPERPHLLGIKAIADVVIHNTDTKEVFLQAIERELL